MRDLGSHHYSAKESWLNVVGSTQSIRTVAESGRIVKGLLEPGRCENLAALDPIADEVACMANTPGGGALIVGIEDKTGRIIGTELDIDWLRQGIYSRIDVAPDIVEKHVQGQRVLAIFVAAAAEPVEDTGGQVALARW